MLSRREQLRKKFDLKSEPANIFMCWLLMWCGTFKYQEKNEREFLAFQAIQVVKKMFYRVEQEVAELIILMMHVAFTEGTEVIVRNFRELYLIDLKLPNHQAVEQFNLRALGRGQALPDSLPDVLFQESAPENQFSRVLNALPRLDRADSSSTRVLGELSANEDARKQAIEGKFQSQFSTTLSEDYQFASFTDMIAANR